jgi:hypothetical protein
MNRANRNAGVALQERFAARTVHFLNGQQSGQITGQVLVRISAFLIWHIID